MVYCLSSFEVEIEFERNCSIGVNSYELRNVFKKKCPNESLVLQI